MINFEIRNIRAPKKKKVFWAVKEQIMYLGSILSVITVNLGRKGAYTP